MPPRQIDQQAPRFVQGKRNNVGSRSTLDLWKHFVVAEDGQTARCKICSKILKTTGGCSIGLRSHFYSGHRNIALKNIIENPTTLSTTNNKKDKSPSDKLRKINTNDRDHAELINGIFRKNDKKIIESFVKKMNNMPDNTKITKNNKSLESTANINQQGVKQIETNTLTQNISIGPDSAKTAKKRKIIDHYKFTDSMETVVARMIALDGANIKLFTQSQDLRRLFKRSGYYLPKSKDSILEMILKNGEHVKEDTRKTILEIKKAGYKFALSLDDWKTNRNKRYINIILHCNALNVCKTLGPVNITESETSNDAFIIINDCLKTFNVSFEEDVVSLTTDGSRDMRKIGIHFCGHHQWCLAQGVQGAVISTMYKTVPEQDNIREKCTDLQESEPMTDSSSETDDDSFVQNGEFAVGKPHMQAELHLFTPVIDKLRRAVKMIMNSPTYTNTLQTYIKNDLNIDTHLQIDNQTRWTSIVDMIGSFLKVKGCVLKLLNNLKSDIVFTEEEISCLSGIHLNLDLLRLVVLSLCREEATLFTADTALRCILIQLEELNSDLSLQLASNLRKQIKDRRLLIAGVLHYLYDLRSFTAFPDDTTFLKPTSEQITELIVGILKQLKFKCVTDDLKKLPTPSSSKKQHSGTTMLIFDQAMELRIKKKKAHTVESTNFGLQRYVSDEMKIYEARGERGICLTKAYEYLLTIIPTNIQPDRIFSVCGCVSTRINSSHPDNILEALIFLRTHYEEQRRTMGKHGNVF